MAVSFKVPASPKRNIAATDTFMGVDLTNTGVNIEGYRSPNAPNMVRHVPGKVRKRMGYYKEILFGRDIDVNYAWGASAAYKEVFVPVDHTSEWIKVYDLIQELKSKDEQAFSLYVEFDYQSAEDFYVINDSTSVTASGEVDPRNDELWAHFSGTVEFESTDTLSDIEFMSVTDQPIYIKEFAIVREKSESYAWSPAPKYFVERESNDPVYGCHILKNGLDGFKGDRVVNTNRALKTSSELTDIEDDFAYDLGEEPPMGTTIYIEFDYSLDTNGVSGRTRLYDTSGGRSLYLDDTNGEIVHFSQTIPVTEFNYRYNEFFRVVSGHTLKVKNFAVLYEKDENYSWSPAPEDIGEKFHVTDIVNVKPKDYAVSDSFSDSHNTTAQDTQYAKEFIIADQDNQPGEYARLSFDITTSSNNVDLNRLTLEVVYQPYSADYELISDVKENYNKKHIDAFFKVDYPHEYISALRVFFYTESATTVKIDISNLKLKTYSVKDSYIVSPKWFLYHVGKDFYLKGEGMDNFEKVFEDANEHRSSSFQLSNKCYIIDGKSIYQYSIEDGGYLEEIGQDNAYIPTVTIAKEPQGGGQSYEAFNLLQPGFYETFIGQAGVTKYCLTFGELDETECEAWVLDSNSNWIHKEENTDFTVNRATGEVTFTTAPGATPLTGEPSVKILAYRTIEDYRSRVTKCTFGTLFGIGGAGDRIFLSGNEDHPNWDFYSQRNDATYFPDIGYATLGSEQSRINGYAIVSNYLATFKDGFDPSQAVFIREGDLLEVEEGAPEEPVFRLINTLQGEGSVAPYSFGYLQTEPLFLTKAGVYAITEQDITGEKYSQDRSFYLDGKLRKEPNMETAIATIYDDQYVLALNNQLFILDGLQSTRTDKSEPYATRQYAGFYCDDIPATCLWTDEQICFGTSDGRVCRFYSDETALESYNDDGKPIYACWETPDLDGQMFYKNKTFRYLAVRLMTAIKTSAKMYSRKLGVWSEIKEETVIQNPIDFENLDFDMFTFSVDTSEKVLHTKLRVKKVDKARFRIENDKLNEPFGISDIALEYIESGNYKG